MYIPMRDIIVIAKTLRLKPRYNHNGVNNNAKADPNVPGALGLRPEPNPTPQKTMQRLNQVICLK
jgi:hypothetical protein